jgi:hypothetical protein
MLTAARGRVRSFAPLPRPRPNPYHICPRTVFAFTSARAELRLFPCKQGNWLSCTPHCGTQSSQRRGRSRGKRSCRRYRILRTTRPIQYTVRTFLCGNRHQHKITHPRGRHSRRTRNSLRYRTSDFRSVQRTRRRTFSGTNCTWPPQKRSRQNAAI